MTRENIRSTVPVKEKTKIRWGLWRSGALPVIGFEGFMVHILGPLGTVDPGQVVYYP